MEAPKQVPPISELVRQVFGPNAEQAAQFEQLLQVHGVERGLIGPREADRLWDRHLINSAVIGEQIPEGASVLDVGSGAGLPGIPLAIARPDLKVILLEPMSRRVEWLKEVSSALGLSVEVIRGRAEDVAVRQTIVGVDVVTARAVAPLGRLAGWSLPFARVGGLMLALKGTSAEEEILRDKAEIAKFGGAVPTIAQCGVGLIETPTTVVLIERLRPEQKSEKRRRNTNRPRGK